MELPQDKRAGGETAERSKWNQNLTEKVSMRGRQGVSLHFKASDPDFYRRGAGKHN